MNSLGLPIYHTRTWGVTTTTQMFPRKEISKNKTGRSVFWNSVSCHKHFLCDIFYSGDTLTKRRWEITAIFLLLGFRAKCKFLRRSMLYWALCRVFVGFYSLYIKHSVNISQTKRYFTDYYNMFILLRWFDILHLIKSSKLLKE